MSALCLCGMPMGYAEMGRKDTRNMSPLLDRKRASGNPGGSPVLVSMKEKIFALGPPDGMRSPERSHIYGLGRPRRWAENAQTRSGVPVDSSDPGGGLGGVFSRCLPTGRYSGAGGGTPSGRVTFLARAGCTGNARA
jgi:hypothetical protein